MKYSQYFTVPLKDQSNPIKDYWGQSAFNSSIPSYLNIGVMPNNWIEKFESSVPSALIFAWDFQD